MGGKGYSICFISYEPYDMGYIVCFILYGPLVLTGALNGLSLALKSFWRDFNMDLDTIRRALKWKMKRFLGRLNAYQGQNFIDSACEHMTHWQCDTAL